MTEKNGYNGSGLTKDEILKLAAEIKGEMDRAKLARDVFNSHRVEIVAWNRGAPTDRKIVQTDPELASYLCHVFGVETISEEGGQ